MAARSESESVSYLRQSDSLKKIDAFFDNLERIFERSGQLLIKAKYVIFALSFLFFLIYEMVRFGYYLLSN